MRRGTTPVFNLTVKGVNFNDAKNIYVTIAQNSTKLTKSGPDVSVFTKDNLLQISLTQEETLLFNMHYGAKIQVRIVMKNGSVVASNIEHVSVLETLSEEVLT